MEEIRRRKEKTQYATRNQSIRADRSTRDTSWLARSRANQRRLLKFQEELQAQYGQLDQLDLITDSEPITVGEMSARRQAINRQVVLIKRIARRYTIDTNASSADAGSSRHNDLKKTAVETDFDYNGADPFCDDDDDDTTEERSNGRAKPSGNANSSINIEHAEPSRVVDEQLPIDMAHSSFNNVHGDAHNVSAMAKHIRALEVKISQLESGLVEHDGDLKDIGAKVAVQRREQTDKVYCICRIVA